MTFVPMKGSTGFEPGHIAIIPASYRSGASIDAATKYRGAYALKLSVAYPTSNAYARFYVTGTPSELYIAGWTAGLTVTGGLDDYSEIAVVLTDGTNVSLRKYVGALTWDAYVNGVLKASGTYQIAEYAWHRIAVYFNIADSGAIQTKVNGVSDISYSGDTKPSTSTTISYIQLLIGQPGVGAADTCHWDDFLMGTGGWPPDISHDMIAPTGNDAVQWTPSAGDNWDCVEELPASTTDYVTTTGSGESGFQDKYAMGDWDDTDKDPKYVAVYAYGYKTEADAHQLKLILDDGVEDVDNPQDLDITWGYVSQIWSTPPSGGLWTDALIDALKAGIEAVII